MRPDRLRRLRRALLAACAALIAGCTALSSSGDFVAPEDTAQPTQDASDTSGGAEDATADATADDADDADAIDTQQALILCGVLCNKLTACPDIPASIDSTTECSTACAQSVRRPDDQSSFACWFRIFQAAVDSGLDPDDMPNLDACPLIGINDLVCGDVIACIEGCNAIDPCGGEAERRCGTACIQNARLPSSDPYIACASEALDDLDGRLDPSPPPAHADIDRALACALADGDMTSPDAACRPPCDALCDAVAVACDDHPAREGYGLPRAGAPTPEALTECARRCEARFGEADAPTTLTPHQDADTAACRIGYLARAVASVNQGDDDAPACAAADLGGGGVCATDADPDGDGLFGAADPCPYSAADPATCAYCAATTPDCDGDGACDDLSADARHCGQCGHGCDPGAPCDAGACAPACDPNPALDRPCAEGSTCDAGFCVRCGGDAPCPQGVLCADQQCEAGAACLFGVCATPTRCAGEVCALYEGCAGAAGGCGCGMSGAACNPAKAACLDGACVSSVTCDGAACQPGEACVAGACACGGAQCGPGAYCADGACAPMPAVDP